MLTADNPEEWISDEEEQSIDEETDLEEKTRIRMPWKQTLIVRLLGRNIGYHFSRKSGTYGNQRQCWT